MDSTLQAALKMQAFADMDEVADYAVTHRNSLEHIHDTQEITDIYLQRPGRLGTESLGAWFAAAHQLDCSALRHCSSTAEARRLILSHEYNRLSLEPLQARNKQFTEK